MEKERYFYFSNFPLVFCENFRAKMKKCNTLLTFPVLPVIFLIKCEF